MSTQITNQATLSYNSGTDTLSASSNTAQIALQGPLEAAKYSLENAYKIGEDITYNIFFKNTSPNTLTNVVISDDLGTYAISETQNVTPLTFKGPAKLFTNNVYTGTVTGTVSGGGDLVTFNIPSIAPGSSLLLQYSAFVNNYAGAVPNTSEIENIVSISADGIATPAITTNTIPVASYALVKIAKAMSPDPVVDGSTLTYNFNIKNYGTIPATNVTLKDEFNPIPAISSVVVDGTATTDYSLAASTFTYPSDASGINYEIPAAVFTQDPATGIVSLSPGESTITVQGTI